VRILVFNRSRLEQPSAQAINVVHTCAALARAGASVVLHADLGRATPDDILRRFGTPPALNLAFQNMGWRWHSVPLRMVAGSLLRSRSKEPTMVFLREVRPYVATLVEAARRRGHRIAFEAHNAAGKMALEAAARAAQAGGVASVTAPVDAQAVPAVAIAAGALAQPGGSPAVSMEGDPGGVAVAAPNVTTPARPHISSNGGLSASDAESAARERAALERMILSSVNLLIAPQRLTLEAVRGLVRPGVPARVVPNGTRLPVRVAPGPKEIDILYLGSLTAWKGVETLVAAMPQLYPYKLSIVGGREERARRVLQQMAVQIGCSERVRFIPPVAPADVWKLYARARVGVVPLASAYLEAREYTCPLKLLEMMAAGLPIVTSRLPSVQEYVREGEEALMARSDDPDDFAATIRRLLEDADLAARLAAGARAKAESLSYEQRARRLLEAFDEAAGN
jgi:glycosyltransferase involved in cell wall biosynthesis